MSKDGGGHQGRHRESIFVVVWADEVRGMYRDRSSGDAVQERLHHTN
jgi:hypothetical protein